MSNKIQLLALVCAGLLGFIAAECPNACSAHGKCGAYDMCTCFRNWMSNDCSERICQFGLAHVDTPKGDLDASSGALSGPDSVVAVNDFVYRFGTTEQYPATTDIAGNVLTNTAHEYRECSNKGICDRSSGTCACFEGYEGSACQRASCPVGPNGVCSGHGTCQTISEIAAADNDNIYKLWDEDSTMGCVCDGGYTGADCSQRQCKVGTDPYYFDNNATLRYTNFTYQFYTDYTGSPVAVTGNYSIVFYDAYGEDWETAPIDINAECAEIQSALEGIPNNVIPVQSVRCYKSDVSTVTYGQQSSSTIDPIYDTSMFVHSKYTIAFPKNPGKLQQIRINKFLDGSRPTLYTDETTSTLGWHIYPNGFIGEDVDIVPDRCFGVLANVAAGSTGELGTHYLTGLDSTEIKLLKKCLGDSDGDDTNNVDVYNWDMGTENNPHLIKLQDATQFTNVYSIDSDGDVFYDPQLQYRPRTLLCDSASYNRDRFGATLSGDVYCHNKNAPAFYSVLFYDATNYASNPFRLFTRAAQDYAATTPFYVYTTTGYLSLVNPTAGVYTFGGNYPPAQRVDSHHSKVLKMKNSVSVAAADAFPGDMSCENNPVGTNAARECLNKGDRIMVLKSPAFGGGDKSNQDALNSNPVYPNIYTVEKIFRERRSNTTAVGPDRFNEIERLNIVLDYSMNAAFSDNLATTAGVARGLAKVYKFYPPTNTPHGGYLHTASCSTRGMCNTDTGLCECFSGYGKDDCSCNTCNNLSF